MFYLKREKKKRGRKILILIRRRFDYSFIFYFGNTFLYYFLQSKIHVYFHQFHNYPHEFSTHIKYLLFEYKYIYIHGHTLE